MSRLFKRLKVWYLTCIGDAFVCCGACGGAGSLSGQGKMVAGEETAPPAPTTPKREWCKVVDIDCTLAHPLPVTPTRTEVSEGLRGVKQEHGEP